MSGELFWYDKEGEAASARTDAITACGERIAADPGKLREVVEAMLIDTDVDVPELLALLYMSGITVERGNHRLAAALKNIDSAISDAIDKAAESEVDEAMAEVEQARWARRHLGGRD